jgi:hypothetical protein
MDEQKRVRIGKEYVDKMFAESEARAANMIRDHLDIIDDRLQKALETIRPSGKTKQPEMSVAQENMFALHQLGETVCRAVCEYQNKTALTVRYLAVKKNGSQVTVVPLVANV